MTASVSAVSRNAPSQEAASLPGLAWTDRVTAQAAYVAIIATVVMSTVWIFLAGPKKYVVTYWPDDALFYNLVARNIVNGLGSTSDGIALTNGYHPLWMWTHVALEWIFPDPIAAQLLLQAVLLIAVLFLLFNYVATLANRTVALGLCLIAASEQSFARVLSSGMETILAFLALLLVLRLLQRRSWQEMTVREQVALSAAMGLLFFARLDGALLWVVFSVLVLVGSLSSGDSLGRRVSFLWRTFSVPALCAVIYFVINQAWFGSAMPVSGRVKSVPVAELFDPVHLRSALDRLAVLYRFDTLSSVEAAIGNAAAVQVVTVLLLAAAVFGIARLRKRFPADTALTLLLSYVALHTVYYAVLQRDPVSMQWARGPELLLMSIGLAGFVFEAADRLSGRRRVALVPTAALICLMLGGVAYNGLKATRLDVVRDFSARTSDFWAAVDLIRSTVPTNAVIASHAIGFVGYFSERRMLSVDGLLNSTEYYRDYLRQNRKLDYIRTHGVRYSINAIPGGENPINFVRTYYPGLRAENVRLIRMFGSSRESSDPWNYALFELSF